MSRYFLILGLLAGACMAACSDAQPQAAAAANTSGVLDATVSYQDFGAYTVHFNATPTSQLTAEVASQYDIVRSQNRALLNISVLENATGSTGTARNATIKATARNLTGQLKNVSLSQIAEGGAIYYVGEVGIANAETLIFSLEVTPQGSEQTYRFSFKKQFFVG